MFYVTDLGEYYFTYKNNRNQDEVNFILVDTKYNKDKGVYESLVAYGCIENGESHIVVKSATEARTIKQLEEKLNKDHLKLNFVFLNVEEEEV